MKNLNKFMIMAAVGAMVVSGCKKDDDGDDVIPNTNRTLAMEVVAHWGVNTFNMANEYSDDFGTKIRFTDIRLYMSNLKSMDMSGNMTGEFDDVILFDASQGAASITLGTVSQSHVHMINGYVGLDSLTNHQDPMLASAPLNDATMHWGWSPMAGYKFAVIEGVADTDGNGVLDGNDSVFVYHLATDALYTPFSMMVHTDIMEGETKTVHVEIDVQEIIDGVEVATSLDTHTNNDFPLAQQLMNNIAASIGIQ